MYTRERRMTTLNSASESMPSAIDAVRLVRTVAPTMMATATPTRNVFSAIGHLTRMYSDPRYRVSPLGRIGPVVVIASLVLNYVFWNYLMPIPFVAPIGERLLLAGLAIGLYLILTRELNRYRKVLEYLAKYG
jgi:hypothetical protein